MSELSDSLHLRGDGPQVVLNLLAAADVQGFVYPPTRGLIPFVCEDDGMQRLLGINRGLLLHYSYDEQRGCSVVVYDGSHRVGRLEASFETERYGFDAQTFQALGLVTSDQVGRLLRWVARAHHPAERSAASRYLVAETLGLSRYARFSFASEMDLADPPPERLASERLSLSPRNAGAAVQPAPQAEAPDSWAPDEPPETEPLYLDALHLDAIEDAAPADAAARFTTLQPDPMSGPSSERASLELDAASSRAPVVDTLRPAAPTAAAARAKKSTAKPRASKAPAAGKARTSKAPAAKKKSASQAAKKPAKKAAAKATRGNGAAAAKKKPATKAAKTSKPVAKKKAKAGSKSAAVAKRR